MHPKSKSFLSETQFTGNTGIWPEDQDQVQTDCRFWGVYGEVPVCVLQTPYEGKHTVFLGNPLSSEAFLRNSESEPNGRQV